VSRASGAGAHYAADSRAARPPRAPHAPPWALPVVLALVAVVAGIGAVVAAREPEPRVLGAEAVPVTPVLSARRVPELLAAPVADRHLGAELSAWLGASPPDSCLVVQAGGRSVFGHNPALPVTGASTQKLLTATGLLLARGPDATFRTEAVAAAEPEGGVVAGDLYLVGGGDAALGQAGWAALQPPTRPKVVHDIDALAASIAAAGVTQVQGSIVGDGSRYDDQLYQPSLAPRLIDQDQIGPVDGLMVNDGFAGFSPDLGVSAAAPAPDPAADAARVLSELLAAHGVTVAGPPRSGEAPEDATTVATLESPPLSTVVAEMLTNSDNETAESAMKEIGLATSDEGTFAAGADGLGRLLADAHVPLDGVQLVDGTGLTTEDRLTCTTLVDVLTRPDTGPVVRDGLAVAGQTGTLALRWRDSPVAGRMRAKTGTLRNVTALAGEVQPVPGGTVDFAYVANVPDPATVTSDGVNIDALPDILVGYGEGIDVAALGPQPAEPAH
jgi:D-alanyl-D-alanine carboxypeptidase/D-alanyl-D-alanine-endopeptidase (penicillin-binding protein 4)